MQLIRGLYNLKHRFINGCVVTIGNYDGVHLGHQQVLERLEQKAKDLQLPSIVIVFEPQPAEVFTDGKSLRLTSLREKMLLLSKYSISSVLVLEFNERFMRMTAQCFVEQILIKQLHAHYLIVGDDFSFGHKRKGDFAILSKTISKLGANIEQVPSFKIDGVRVSSSLIRAALLRDDLKLVAKFLGRPYRVIGRVVHGSRIGLNIGFPTANINLKYQELVLTGVYAVKIDIDDKEFLFGIANIGFRPTIMGKYKILEIHIFNFNADIYGKIVMVEFYKKIRDEQKFRSLDDLRLQIELDVKKVKGMYNIN